MYIRCDDSKGNEIRKPLLFQGQHIESTLTNIFDVKEYEDNARFFLINISKESLDDDDEEGTSAPTMSGSS